MYTTSRSDTNISTAVPLSTSAVAARMRPTPRPTLPRRRAGSAPGSRSGGRPAPRCSRGSAPASSARGRARGRLPRVQAVPGVPVHAQVSFPFDAGFGGRGLCGVPLPANGSATSASLTRMARSSSSLALAAIQARTRSKVARRGEVPRRSLPAKEGLPTDSSPSIEALVPLTARNASTSPRRSGPSGGYPARARNSP